MEELTIGEVARQAGLRPSALRYYESAGLLAPPRRRRSRRLYDPSVLQQLAFIAVAQQAGFTVAEIGHLLHGFAPDVTPAERWRALAERKLDEVAAAIARAQAMQRLLEHGLRCGCLRFEDCLIVAGQGCVAPEAPPAVDLRPPGQGRQKD